MSVLYYHDVPWCRMRSAVFDICGDVEVDPNIAFDNFETIEKKRVFLEQAIQTLMQVAVRLEENTALKKA